MHPERRNLPGGEKSRLGEGLQFLGWFHEPSFRSRNVNLDRLFSLGIAGVLHIESDIETVALRRYLKVTVLEGGVTQSESERVQRLYSLGVEIPVSDEDVLIVAYL